MQAQQRPDVRCMLLSSGFFVRIERFNWKKKLIPKDY